jgi:hypothetical protein
VDRFEIVARLAAVEALEIEGATPGERAAAREARLRLEARLGDAARAGGAHATELALAHHHVTAATAESTLDREAAGPAPGAAEVRRRVAAWRDGRLGRGALRRWAASAVDRFVLPQHPLHHPDVRAAEVLLALSGRGLRRPNAGAVLAFLDAEPEDAEGAWARWMELLAGAVS